MTDYMGCAGRIMYDLHQRKGFDFHDVDEDIQVEIRKQIASTIKKYDEVSKGGE